MNNDIPTAYILTSAWNDYDQHGEYFVSWFSHKPSFTQLELALQRYEDKLPYNHLVNHVLSGGGRQKNENLWYFLREMKPADVRN